MVRREKVVVAMSGGVDSSVAACLLVEQGYDVVGFFMRIGAEEPPATQSGGRERRGCCSASDAGDARFVAGVLDVPFFSLNFKTEFDELIDYFADEYVRARTPNPCVVCNQKFKFARLFDYADAVGARYVATGHYARIDRSGSQPVMRRAVDAAKDQSYVLFGIEQARLDRILFPLGDIEKGRVREIARERNLPNADKPDSVEICFVPDNDYAGLVRRRRPDAFREGRIVDEGGTELGRHGGIGNYTVGQRRGVGVAVGVPIYVTGLDAETNTVTVGSRESLLRNGLTMSDVNRLAGDLPDEFRAEVKIRYLHRAAPASVLLNGDRTGRIEFDEPQTAITPGQAVVFYDGDLVLGGGWIERSLTV